MTILIVLLGLALAGCGGPLSLKADQIDALAKDPATVCVFSQVVYGPGAGSLTVARTNIVSGNLKCSKEGLELTSAPPGVTVPIAVTPQFRIEQPTLSPTR